MTNYLVQQATQKIWCEPVEDNQYYIAPARLTVNGGASKYATVLWNAIDLPNAGNAADRSYYHVYQIGKLDARIFSINLDDTWQLVESLCNANNCIIDLYLDMGAIIPRASGWLRQTFDGNILACVQINPLLDLGTFNTTVLGVITAQAVTLDTNVLYIRFFKDAVITDPTYLATLDNPTQLIRSIHVDITTATTMSNFLGQCDAIEAGYPHGGKGIFQIGGFVVSRPVAFRQAYAGVRFTYTFDETILRQVIYPLANCPTFVSTLDAGKSKYILLADNSYTGIEYYGDLDFYLISTNADGTYQGVYLNRADPTAVRMITHNAYAVSTQLVAAYATENVFLNRGLPLAILTMQRKAGQAHALTFVSSKLHELYRLPVAGILQAMSGVNSDVPEWHAATLEASPYCALMTTSMSGVTLEVAEATYGYNAICSMMNPIPQATTVAGAELQIHATPAMLIPDATTGLGVRTLYGYDSQGLLIGWTNDTTLNPAITLPSNLAGSTLVETLQSISSTTLDGVVMGNTDIIDTRLAQYGFRVYACVNDVSGTPTEDWADVTDSAFYTYYPNGSTTGTSTIEFNHTLLATNNLFMAVRIGGTVLAFNVPLQTTNWDGIIRFSIDSTVTWLGQVVSRPQSIPAGIVDVFMGAPGAPMASLIDGIDYYMQWPQIVIVKRPPNGEIPNVFVRAYGFCNPTTNQPWPAREYGFVSGGVLSVGSHYNVRDDRPVRIVTNGQLCPRSNVRFAEATNGPLVVDGRPYAVTDYYQQIEPFTTVDTMAYRQAALDMDNRVGAYLSSRLPTYTPINPVIANAKWDVFSPFLGAIIAAFNFGFLNAGQLYTPYTNLDVASWVAPWLYLLPYDPCVVGVSKNFIEVYPHMYYQVVTVTNVQYVFLEYLIANYLNNNTSLSEAVNIVG